MRPSPPCWRPRANGSSVTASARRGVLKGRLHDLPWGRGGSYLAGPVRSDKTAAPPPPPRLAAAVPELPGPVPRAYNVCVTHGHRSGLRHLSAPRAEATDASLAHPVVLSPDCLPFLSFPVPTGQPRPAQRSSLSLAFSQRLTPLSLSLSAGVLQFLVGAAGR